MNPHTFKTGDIVYLAFPGNGQYQLMFNGYRAILESKITPSHWGYSADHEKFIFRMLEGPLSQGQTQNYLSNTDNFQWNNPALSTDHTKQGGLPKL